MRKHVGQFLKTSLPAALDLASQTIMWTIEAVFIGKLGASALAGHGMAIQVIIVFFSILLTFIVGAGLVINRHLGAKQYGEANHILGQAMMLTIVIAILIAITWHFGAVHIFKLIREGCSVDAQLAGESYIRTLAFFAPFLVVNFVGTGIIRAIGQTTFSMFINLTVNALNLLLAPLLIYGWLGFPRLQVAGAALAVGCAHTVGFFIMIFLLCSGKLAIRLSLHDLTVPRWSSFKTLFKNGVPTTIEQSAWAVGALIVMGYVGQLGVTALTVHSILLRIQNILSMIYMGFSLAAMSQMGQNLGAANKKRAELLAIVSHRSMFAFIMLIIVILITFSKMIFAIFTTDPQTLELGRFVIYFFAAAQLPKALNNVISGNLRGIGNLQWLMLNVIIFVLIFEVGLNYIAAFILGWGLAALWGIQACDELLRFSMNYLKFIKGSWRR